MAPAPTCSTDAMPLYEYQCKACGHRFEVIQKFSDPQVDTCPSCGRTAVEKLMSSPAIQFKGSGWYITDYARKDSGSSKSEKPSSSESKGEAKTETKSDSKTDAKSDTSSAGKTDSKS
jgi:putative FmdB family regulatory protein